jgi:RNA polymerase sigma factor (sigma-70 family)
LAPTFLPSSASLLLRVFVLKTRSDATLADCAKRGKPGAMELLLERLEPEVAKVTRATVGLGLWSAEEAAQEAMMDIVTGIGTLKDPEAIVGWARRIASRRAIRAIRREQARGEEPLDLELLRRSFNRLGPDDPIEALRGVTLADAFRTLPARLRAVAGLRLLLGMSEAEVADALEIAQGTVKSHLHAARQRRQVELRKGGEEPVVG